ncbi:MAG: phosphoglycerate dehydrogenase [SAR324 cluster bacterium]|nr:phosphoglycerate dehydrogenase [SAR324 cluster bacterium]
MFRILTLNQISIKGLDQFPRDSYEVASEIGHPDAMLLRSHKLASEALTSSVKAIARAGAGVNNIPVDHCTEKGIVVFNTPGANANAVKELVLSGLLLSSRGIIEGIHFSRNLNKNMAYDEMNKLVEKEKKNFGGNEIAGKTLGVIGLGAIGSMVAEMGLKLGMKVYGYDPALSVEAAWRLSNEVQQAENIPSLLSRSDYVTLHLPVMESTIKLINTNNIKNLKKGGCLLNFSRAEIVETGAVLQAIADKRLNHYVTDFPVPEFIEIPQIIMMPHIGASTEEAEDNCAVMAASQLKDFLEHGNIRNSVNFPALNLERSSGYRLALTNKNIPKMLSKILAILADKNINVIDMINKSRNEIAYNLIDIETKPSEELISILKEIEGVINVRSL